MVEERCKPAVYAVEGLFLCALCAVLLHHLIPLVPGPLALLIVLIGVIKVSSFEDMLVVCHYRKRQHIDRCNIVLVVEHELVSCALNVLPQGLLKVNYLVDRLEHSCDYAVGECHTLLIPEYIRHLVTHYGCSKLFKLVERCSS